MKPKTDTTPDLAIVAPEKADTAIARPMPTPADMMAQMIDKGITQENVAAFKELVVLSEHMEDRQSKRDFAKDFLNLMSEMKKVQATKIIPDRNGDMRSSFAPFEEIDEQVRPICLAHGFSYWFSEGESQPGKITKVFNLMHSSGHTRTNSYTSRIGAGPPGCSETQADGSAHSYAKRGAMCDGLSIVVHGIDDDARNEGHPITLEQADELERRVKLTNSDVNAFLKLAGAKMFREIMSDKYEMLDEMLQRKESRGR